MDILKNDEIRQAVYQGARPVAVALAGVVALDPALRGPALGGRVPVLDDHQRPSG
jgi:hypothetical protein